MVARRLKILPKELFHHINRECRSIYNIGNNQFHLTEIRQTIRKECPLNKIKFSYKIITYKSMQRAWHIKSVRGKNRRKVTLFLFLYTKRNWSRILESQKVKCLRMTSLRNLKPVSPDQDVCRWVV